MTETADTQPGAQLDKLATLPTIEPPKKRIPGICLLEIWRTSRYSAPNWFWRELQADMTFSLWRFMEPAFGKKALKMRHFWLDKDGIEVEYAARPFDVRTATLDDYERVRKLTNAFKSAPDPLLLCRDCQGTKEIQATRPKGDGRVERFVTDCPGCASIPEPVAYVPDTPTEADRAGLPEVSCTCYPDAADAAKRNCGECPR